MRSLTILVSACFLLAVPACTNDSGGGTSSPGGAGGTSTTTSTSASTTATTGSGTGGAGGVGGTGFGGFIGTTGGSGGNQPVTLEEAGISPDSLPPLPEIACDPNNSASECTLPASVCADSAWLVFYTDPQCVDSLCAWNAMALQCDVTYACINGGCEYNFTL